jgi:hypothetical protein
MNETNLLIAVVRGLFCMGLVWAIYFMRERHRRRQEQSVPWLKNEDMAAFNRELQEKIDEMVGGSGFDYFQRASWVGPRRVIVTISSRKIVNQLKALIGNQFMGVTVEFKVGTIQVRKLKNTVTGGGK